MADDEDELTDKLLIVGRVLVTVLVGVLGMYGCAMIGSLSYPGVGVVVGGLFGLVFGSCFGCCVTGLWRHTVPEGLVTKAADAVPAPIAFALGDHGPFTLIVTVHNITGKTGLMARLGDTLGASSFTFVQVDCGSNPVKKTCARPDLQYNEQFKLKVKAMDGGLSFTIKDQDIFGTTTVGQVNIHIKRDIIDQQFPPRARHPGGERPPDGQAYPITNRAGSLKDYSSVMLHLSFDHTDDYHGPEDDLEAPLLKKSGDTVNTTCWYGDQNKNLDKDLNKITKEQFVTKR